MRPPCHKWGKIFRNTNQHLPKVYSEIIREDKPNSMNRKSIGLPATITSSGRNIAINGNIHAMMRVNPVESNLFTRVGNTLFCLRALIAPSLSLFALLNIDIAARTKPNRMPDIVESTPAVVSTSACFIGLNSFVAA